MARGDLVSRTPYKPFTITNGPEKSPRAKLSHAEVHYGTSTSDDYCLGCNHYEFGCPAISTTSAMIDGAGKPHCEIVEDPIKSNGWCDRFERSPREFFLSA